MRYRPLFALAAALLSSSLLAAGPAPSGTAETRLPGKGETRPSTTCLPTGEPAATLLIPYFEVDLDDGDGLTTLFAVGNASEDPVMAHAVIWTDCGLPVLDFDFLLDGNQVRTVNLRDVLLFGQLPPSAPGCAAAEPNLAVLQAQLTGRPDPRDGMCWGSPREGPRLAVGYVTIDAVNSCSAEISSPLDPGYFGEGDTGLASDRNVLWGDFFYIETGENFAQGFSAVDVRADPIRVPGLVVGSFYPVPDSDRLPLGREFRSRFLSGGGFDGGTELILWTEGLPERQPQSCGFESCGAATFQWLKVVFRDEAGEELGETLFTPTGVTTKVPVGGEQLPVAANFGLMEMELQIPPVDPPLRNVLHGWVLPVYSALGRYSVGLSATALPRLCPDPPPPVSPPTSP